MKAQIKNGAVLLPKKIMKSIHLPENGECEIKQEKDEIKIRKTVPRPKNIIAFLKSKRKQVSINEIISISTPEVD